MRNPSTGDRIKQCQELEALNSLSVKAGTNGVASRLPRHASSRPPGASGLYQTRAILGTRRKPTSNRPDREARPSSPRRRFQKKRGSNRLPRSKMDRDSMRHRRMFGQTPRTKERVWPKPWKKKVHDWKRPSRMVVRRHVNRSENCPRSSS